MDWERIGRIAGRFFLIVIEFVFKLCATVAAAIALAAPGGLPEKIGAGFGSLTTWLRKLTGAPAEIAEMGRMINDFNTQTAAEFTETYGAGAIQLLIYELNMAVDYVQSVYRNLAQNPFSTLLASIVVFLAFYMLARTLRFFRQKGQGSPLTRLERRLGEKAFDLNKAAKVEEILAASTPKSKTQQASGSPASAAKPQASISRSRRSGTGTGASQASGARPKPKPKSESESDLKSKSPIQPRDSGDEKGKEKESKPPQSPSKRDPESGPKSLDGILKSARSSSDEEDDE